MSFVSKFLRPIISEQKKVQVTPAVKPATVKPQVVETPIEEATVDETTVDATTVVEALVEETAVKEAPVEKTPVEEAAAEEAAAEEAPVEESPIEGTTVEETPVVEDKPVKNAISIQSLFEKKNITIESSTKKPAVNSIFALSNSIANSYSQTKPLIHYIRDCITKKNFSLTFCTKSYPLAQQQKMEELAYLLEKHGILSGVYTNKKTFIIGGKISSAPNVINFITGDFLEIFTRGVITNVLKTSAEMYHCDYEVLTNVKIEATTGEKHELDAVIRLGEKLFIIEAKSGKFDPDHYRKVGLALGFIPDKLLLLAADKANDLCASIAYFYEYYTANVETFKSTLVAMINHNMSTN